MGDITVLILIFQSERLCSGVTFSLLVLLVVHENDVKMRHAG